MTDFFDDDQEVSPILDDDLDGGNEGAGGLPDDVVLTDDGALPEWYRDIEWSQTQSVSGFCVPVSVGIIVSELTGEVHGELELVGAAIEAGLLTQNPDGAWSGMSAEGAEWLLEHFGIPAHVEHNVPLDQVETWIEEGRHVIVGVDSDEVWQDTDDDLVPSDLGPDHALVVKEIDEVQGQVILFDPGDPLVPIREIPIEKFVDAWQDGNNEAIVTEVAPPDSPDIVTGPPPPSAAPAPPADSAGQPVADAKTPAPQPVAGSDTPDHDGPSVALDESTAASVAWVARFAPAAGVAILAIYLGRGSTSRSV